MRIFFSLLFLAAALGSALFLADKNSSLPVLGTKSPGEEPAGNISPTELELTYDGVNYKASWVFVDDEVILIPNFSEKKTARSVYEDYGCKAVVNAGFYDSDGSAFIPIGLFVVDGRQISGYRQNVVHNGILSINTFGTPRITRSVPDDPLVSAVQTGPVLQENGTALTLNMQKDKKSRRIVAAVTGSNQLLFIAIHKAGSVFSGPLLADLPGIVSAVEQEKSLGIADAINLDGGTASAFYTEFTNLSEASVVGSLFCIK